MGSAGCSRSGNASLVRYLILESYREGEGAKLQLKIRARVTAVMRRQTKLTPRGGVS